MRWTAVVMLAAATSAMHLSSTSDPCKDVECRAGRECISSDGIAQCLCVTSCPDHDRPVCGDDGQSYDNYCLLHQRACLTGEHIRMDYKGYCKKDIEEALREFGIFSTAKPTTSSTTAKSLLQETHLSVCYGPQRDRLRDNVISTWQKGVHSLPWYTEGMGYRESLSGHFFSCDKDRDYLLRPDELLDCFTDVPFSPRPEQDLTVTKTLCIDAMVEETDTNKDWKLDLQEFNHLLDPFVKLVAKNCSLEGKDYTDGAEVRVTCNHCVCATGSWVCATHECDHPTTEATISHNTEEAFGYMDTKYDLKNDSKNNLEDDYDEDYYDEDYDEDDLMNEYKKDEAKKEYNLLSDEDKLKLRHLEDKVRKLQHETGHFHESNSIHEVPPVVHHTSENTAEDESEELIAEEDNIVEQYDQLLQKSRAIRERLTHLRESLSNIEHRKENHHRTSAHHSSHDISHNVIDLDPNSVERKTRKQKKYDAYKQSLEARMQRNRVLSQVDNDIWEDQWKAKISKHHHHDGLSNHL